MLPGVVCPKLLRSAATHKAAAMIIGRGLRFILRTKGLRWYGAKPSAFRTPTKSAYLSVRETQFEAWLRLARICRGWNGQPAEPHGQLTDLALQSLDRALATNRLLVRVDPGLDRAKLIQDRARRSVER